MVISRHLLLGGILLIISFFVRSWRGDYHLNKRRPHCVLKVDLQKTNDFVNWDFLFGVLLAIGTSLRFVSWVRACITSLCSR